ncbi:MAG: hypothetical protein GY937_14270 [bacterium]|nr:hypothetical protein [bacterium]
MNNAQRYVLAIGLGVMSLISGMKCFVDLLDDFAGSPAPWALVAIGCLVGAAVVVAGRSKRDRVAIGGESEKGALPSSPRSPVVEEDGASDDALEEPPVRKDSAGGGSRLVYELLAAAAAVVAGVWLGSLINPAAPLARHLGHYMVMGAVGVGLAWAILGSRPKTTRVVAGLWLGVLLEAGNDFSANANEKRRLAELASEFRVVQERLHEDVADVYGEFLDPFEALTVETLATRKDRVALRAALLQAKQQLPGLRIKAEASIRGFLVEMEALDYHAAAGAREGLEERKRVEDGTLSAYDRAVDRLIMLIDFLDDNENQFDGDTQVFLFASQGIADEFTALLQSYVEAETELTAARAEALEVQQQGIDQMTRGLAEMEGGELVGGGSEIQRE